MLRADAIGWRLLFALMIICSIATIPQFDHLISEWEDSIEGEQPVSGEENQTYSPEEDHQAEDSSFEESDDDTQSDAGIQSEKFSEPEGADLDLGPSQNLDAEWVLPATQIIVLSVMALMVISILSSATSLMITSEAARVGILLAIAGPIIAISQRGESGTFTRGRILGYVEANPGIHFSALRDALEIANGVCAHHLKVLEKEGS